MINTKVVIDLGEIPREWVFEYYLNLPDKLIGQDVRIKSPFNSADTNPSAFVYYKSGMYLFKDFSSGFGGDGIELVCKLFGLSRGDSFYKIREDYEKWLNGNNKETRIIIPADKYKVTEHEVRKFTTTDEWFWKRYGIGSELLNKYKVSALESITLDNTKNSFKVSNRLLYGYFNCSGLYKVYQPYCEPKFLKIQDYIQGTEQLENHKLLIITSSLKDIMSIRAIYSNIDVIAPDAEKTILSENIISVLKAKYGRIVVMMDNDSTGIQSMNIYNEKYNLPFLVFHLAKDFSDAIKLYGTNRTKEMFEQLFKNI